MMTGGYDEGYTACRCFWGQEPGSYVKRLIEMQPSLAGLKVLDLGCGEGKNAIHFARRGARVTAIDISEQALKNAKDMWPAAEYDNVAWAVKDVMLFDFDDGPYDVVIMYGLFHCLQDADAVLDMVRRVQANTVKGGYNVLCAFNDRKHDLSAHAGFSPLLLQHEFYTSLYSYWELLMVSDDDLFEAHPHNNIPHFHSLTRAVARRPE